MESTSAPGKSLGRIIARLPASLQCRPCEQRLQLLHSFRKSAAINPEKHLPQTNSWAIALAGE